MSSKDCNQSISTSEESRFYLTQHSSRIRIQYTLSSQQTPTKLRNRPRQFLQKSRNKLRSQQQLMVGTRLHPLARTQAARLGSVHSFGSLVEISKQLVEEIAYGLLLSEVDFIWVVRGDNFDSFMDNFRVESKEKGLITLWCNQIRILSDPAIGGFFTHCGWNSILESVWCGVPMICYPLAYDQPTNREFVVDDWKIGISLCDYRISVDRKEVAKKIKNLMSGDLKHEVKKVNRILENDLGAVGSSDRNFDQFTKNSDIFNLYLHKLKSN